MYCMATSRTFYRQKTQSNKLIDIVVRQPLDERSTIEILKDTNVPTANGKFITLSQIARPHFRWEPGVIWREGREWAITVQADVGDGIQGPTVSSQINPELNKLRASLPAGYKIDLAGTAADSGKAQDSIAANVPLVIFIIFTLLMLHGTVGNCRRSVSLAYFAAAVWLRRAVGGDCFVWDDYS